MWEGPRESQIDQQAGAEWSESAEWPETKNAYTREAESGSWKPEHGSETAEKDAWREEEHWAEESQPSGPYTEEPIGGNTETWEATPAEAAGDYKASESESTHSEAASAAEEQAWEESWEEPAADWQASGEQASSETDYRQEWPSDGAAAAEEWNDDGAVRDTVMDDTQSTKHPSQEWREDAAAWNAAEDGK